MAVVQKFYKVLKEDMTSHMGFQYQEGLNVDPTPFDPTGTCRPGGLYFVHVSYLYWYLAIGCYGDHICEVTVPVGAKVYVDQSYNIGNDVYLSKFKADQIILGAPEKVTFEVFSRLVAEGMLYIPVKVCSLNPPNTPIMSFWDHFPVKKVNKVPQELKDAYIVLSGFPRRTVAKMHTMYRQLSYAYPALHPRVKADIRALERQFQVPFERSISFGRI